MSDSNTPSNSSSPAPVAESNMEITVETIAEWAKKRAKTAREANAIASAVAKAVEEAQTAPSLPENNPIAAKKAEITKALSLIAQRCCVEQPGRFKCPVSSTSVGSNTSSTSSVGGGCQPLTEDENLYLCNFEEWLLGGDLTEEKYELITQFMNKLPDERQTIYYARFAEARKSPHTEMCVLLLLWDKYDETGHIAERVLNATKMIMALFETQ